MGMDKDEENQALENFEQSLLAIIQMPEFRRHFEEAFEEGEANLALVSKAIRERYLDDQFSRLRNLKVEERQRLLLLLVIRLQARSRESRTIPNHHLKELNALLQQSDISRTEQLLILVAKYLTNSEENLVPFMEVLESLEAEDPFLFASFSAVLTGKFEFTPKASDDYKKAIRELDPLLARFSFYHMDPDARETMLKHTLSLLSPSLLDVRSSSLENVAKILAGIYPLLAPEEKEKVFPTIKSLIEVLQDSQQWIILNPLGILYPIIQEAKIAPDFNLGTFIEKQLERDDISPEEKFLVFRGHFGAVSFLLTLPGGSCRIHG